MLPLMDSAYTLARYLSRDPVAAEDIVQDAYLRAFRSFHTHRGKAPKPWLLAIVRNCFLTWVKAEQTRHLRFQTLDREAEDAISFIDRHAIDHDDPEVLLLRRHDTETVRRALEGLPEPFRECLMLREIEDLSYKEIARLTEAPLGTVMSRLARGRQMMGSLLRMNGQTPEGSPQ
tara:strand:+ start:1833 stop:2357 length:525 start_codon:yes stop_codon:yes gene_type:complete